MCTNLGCKHVVQGHGCEAWGAKFALHPKKIKFIGHMYYSNHKSPYVYNTKMDSKLLVFNFKLICFKNLDKELKKSKTEKKHIF